MYQKSYAFWRIKKAIEGITNTMLTNSLRELEADGLVSRIQFNEIPPHVEYSLTEKEPHYFPFLRNDNVGITIYPLI